MTGRHVGVWLALSALLALEGLWAQQSATISGVVSDTSSAVVPGAEVRLVNTQTGETYSATSNEAGSYTIPFVKPGTYELQAESAGFKQYKQPGIVLDTAAAARGDITLTLGELTEVVTVEADIPLLKTENSSVGHIVKNKTIVNMPLIDRRAAQLVRLSGFVVQTGTSAQFQIAGGRSNNAMWTLDGGSTQNQILGTPGLDFDPPIEALEEMNVEVANYKAEMGRSGGGYIQMTTRSGTNQFHGAAYEFLRNDAMDTRQFFADDKQKLRRNQFGWAFGGPIRKDRTFFFASQEFVRDITADPVLENIPAPAELRGDFSGLTNVTIRDPFTRTVLPNKQVPQSQMDPIGVAVTQFWPTPNIPGRPSRNLNFQSFATTKTPSQAFSARFDHTITDKHRIYGRYVHNFNNRTEGAGVWPLDVHQLTRIFDNSYYNVSATAISNLTTRLIAEYRFTWNKRRNHPTMPSQGAGWAEKLGLRGTNPEYFPGFGFAGGIQRIGRAGGQERRQFPIRDNHFMTNWTYVAGLHTLKWGFEIRVSRNDDVQLDSAGGSFNFTNNAAGDSIAALLYGYVANAARAETFLLRSRADTYGSYIQDDWKVNSKLTLNMGLRFDMDTPRWEKIDNRQNSFDELGINPACNCPGVITWSGRGARGGSKYVHNFDRNNFGPRLGFAYRPTDKWVVRGGASMVYMGQYDQATPINVNAGFSVRGSFTGLNPNAAAFLLKDGLPPIIVPTEADLVPEFGAVAIGAAPVFAAEFFQPEDRPTPYLLNYNLNIQRQLPGNMLFEVGFLSTMGRKLTQSGGVTLNQIHPDAIHWVDQGVNSQVLRPFPQYSDVTLLAATYGRSNYNGVNFKLEKRYSQGLQFNMNYTFARTLDDVEGRNELAGEDGNAAFANQYDRTIAYGLGGSHIKHRFITAAVWEIPWGKGRPRSFSNGVLNQIAGGWTIGTVIEARTGPPFSVGWGNASQVYPTAAKVRADINGEYRENDAWRDDVLGQTYFDPSIFSQPRRFTFGNLGRNTFIGPGALRADASLIKEIYMPFEGHSLQFRGEVINFPNRPNFATPNQNIQAANFGAVSSLTVDASGRVIQLGLRYSF